ncbi:MAG: hypothetical protein KDI75_09020 [Xanthomonadales bacterium]|nr:hypothetical protein [Xanthomonadales bacterium]
MQKLSAVVILSLSLFTAAAAQAATFNVTNTDASGAGSFLAALNSANASADTSNTITFDESLSGTIAPVFLSSDLPLISVPELTIVGPPNSTVTLDLSDFQRLTLDADVTFLRIQDLTIVGGEAFRGGCLNSQHGAELQLAYVTFEDCVAKPSNMAEYARGGAVYSTGLTWIQGSIFINNRAQGGTTDGAEGGAVFVTPLAVGTALNVISSVFLQNEAASDKDGVSVNGGAIRILGNISVRIEDSDFSSNRTTLNGAGSGGSGGAISGVFGELKLRRNLLYANTSANGASVLHFAAGSPTDRSPADIENNTFFENFGNANAASNNGAAIMIYRSALRMRNNGFRNNRAGSGAGSLQYGGDIDLVAIANNAFDLDSNNGSPSCGVSFPTVPDTVFDGSNNYFSDNSCDFLAAAGTQHPGLNLMATTTSPSSLGFALMPVFPSPLIDGGSNGESDIDWTLCPSTDQLGNPRPQDNDADGDARCTAGPAENAFGLPPTIFSHGFED